MKKLYSFFRHNSGICIGVPLCCFVLIYAYACQSTVVSLVHPNRSITRAELIDEVDAFLASAETRIEDLNRQDLVKNTMFNTAIEVLQGVSLNPAGVAVVLGSILGLGAVVDNVRKRTHINTLKGETLNVKVKKSLKEILQPKEI